MEAKETNNPTAISLFDNWNFMEVQVLGNTSSTFERKKYEKAYLTLSSHL